MKRGLWLWLKKYHMRHHYQDDHVGFGVTSPLWDYVFGTRSAPEAVERPARTRVGAEQRTDRLAAIGSSLRKTGLRIDLRSAVAFSWSLISAMPPVEITQVVSKADRDAFIKFPWRIYQDDSAWVPPLLLERKEFLDQKKHPFFEHGNAALFLARADGEIVGRIMASDDPSYNSFHGSNVGCFGLFECVNDPAIAAALFEAGAKWLRGRGREMMGPIDYSTNYVCGLLVEGFDFPPTLLTAHNPPYYQALIEGFGFNKVTDFYAWWFSEPSRAATVLDSPLPEET